MFLLIVVPFFPFSISSLAESSSLSQPKPHSQVGQGHCFDAHAHREERKRERDIFFSPFLLSCRELSSWLVPPGKASALQVRLAQRVSGIRSLQEGVREFVDSKQPVKWGRRDPWPAQRQGPSEVQRNQD